MYDTKLTTNYELSIIVPGIRTYNWENLYNSVRDTFGRSWEMVFVGPYPPPESLSNKGNIKFIQDWGTPIRCQQIGLLNCSGTWITWIADDGYYLEKGLDICFEYIDTITDPMKQIVMNKYYEGQDHTVRMTPEDTVMILKDYYLLSYHDATRAPIIPDNYYTLMSGFLHRDLLFEVGGWDCKFEVCPMSYADLAVRLQNMGVEFLFPEEVIVKVGHMPCTTGDHAPVHYAQVLNDQPLYTQMYSDPQNINRSIIDINNWQSAATKWQRRFGV